MGQYNLLMCEIIMLTFLKIYFKSYQFIFYRILVVLNLF